MKPPRFSKQKHCLSEHGPSAPPKTKHGSLLADLEPEVQWGNCPRLSAINARPETEMTRSCRGRRAGLLGAITGPENSVCRRGAAGRSSHAPVRPRCLSSRESTCACATCVCATCACATSARTRAGRSRLSGKARTPLCLAGKTRALEEAARLCLLLVG